VIKYGAPARCSPTEGDAKAFLLALLTGKPFGRHWGVGCVSDRGWVQWGRQPEPSIWQVVKAIDQI
jgi:hypothetical protein